MKECFICFDNSVCDKYKCSCEIDTCIDCLKKWIFANKDKDPNCPNCLKIIPINNIYEIFENQFMNDEYYSIRSNFLFQKERNFFIEDMEYVNNEIKRRKLMTSLRSLYAKKRQLKRLKKSLDEINQEIKFIINEKSKYLSNNINKIKKNKVMAILLTCPRKNCRGMIMMQDNKCCLCDCIICFDCLQIISNDHKCLENDIETATEIKNNTKACPNCAIRIYKISGCDQMWCTQCHTTFSYESGKKLNNTMIHNPHYIEYIFNNNENNENINNCEQYNFIGYINSQLNNNENLKKYKSQIIYIINKIYDYEYNKLYKYDVDPLKTNSDIRIKYLLNDLNENDLKRLLYKREKRNLKKNGVYQILQIFIQTSKDIMVRAVNDENGDFEKYIKEMRNLINYCYDICESINQNYGGNFNEITKLLSL